MASGIGSDGIVEIFLPPGGTAGQALVKIDTQNYNATWGAGGGGGGIGTITGAGGGATGPTVSLSNANGVTFGINGNTITASVAAVGGAQTGISSLIAGQTQTIGALSFSNASGVSFGIVSGALTGTFTASVRTDYQSSNANYLTSQSNQAFSAQGGSSAFQTLVFTNSNGVSFSNTNGSVWASVAAQSVQTQASGAIAGSGFTSGGAGIGLSGTLNSNGLSLSATVPSQSVQTLGIYASSQTFGQSSSSTHSATALTVVGSGAVSVGWSNSSLLFSVPVQSVQTQASGAIAGTGFTSAGANISLSGTLNTAGLSLSASVAAQSNQSAIKGLGASNTGNTAGNTGISSGIDWVLAGSNNITISESTVGGGPNTLWVSGPSVAGAQTGISGIIVSNTTYTSGTVSFSNANGISFGSSAGQAITASYTVPTQTNQSAIKGLGASNTGNTAGNTGISSGIDWVIAGSNNITISESTVGGGPNTLWVSGANAGGAQTGISSVIAGQTQTAGAISFSNLNGVTFGLSSGAVTATITASVAAQSVQTQASGAIAGSGFTSAGNNIGLSGTLNSLGLSLSATVAAQSNQSAIKGLGASNTGNTAGNTGISTGIDWVIAGSNNITISESTVGGGPNTLWVSGPSVGGAQTGISGIQVSDTTYTSGTVTFRNANGISFGSSGAQGISASYTVPTVTNSSWTVSDANTSATVGRLAFTQSNGLTLSLSTSNNGNHTVIGSYTVPTVTNSSMTVSDNATSGTLARLAFTNLNGVTLSLSTGAGGSHTIVGSHNALTSQSNQAFSAAGGSSAFQTLGFSDNSAASWTNTNGSVALASVRASLYATSNTTQSSTGTANLNSLIFAGAGIASVGVTNGSVVISVPSGGGAGDGGVFAGVSTMGNTAGSTGTVSTGNFVLVGTGALTLSQSTAAAGSAATITFSVPQTSSLVGVNLTLSTNGSTISISAPNSSLLSGVNGISLSTNGSTISISGLAATNSWWAPEVYGNTFTTTFANNTVYFRPVALDAYYNINNLMLQGSGSSSLSTASFSGSLHTSAANVTSSSVGTGQYSFLGTVLLFSRFNTNETHASFNNIQTFYSNTYSVGAGYSATVKWSMATSSASISVTTSGAVSYIANVDTAGNITTSATTSSNSTTFSSTSTNAQTISSSFILSFPYAHRSGFRPIFAPMSDTLVSPGQYWVGLQQSTATGSTNFSLQNVARIVSEHLLVYTVTTNNYAEIGNSVAITSSNWRLGFGSHSNTSGTTTTMGLTAISAMTSNASVWLALNGNTR